MLLKYHIGGYILGLLCLGVRVWFGWGGIRVTEPHPNFNTQQNKERNSKCGISTT